MSYMTDLAAVLNDKFAKKAMTAFNIEKFEEKQ